MKIYILVRYKYDEDGGNYRTQNIFIDTSEDNCINCFKKKTGTEKLIDSKFVPNLINLDYPSNMKHRTIYYDGEGEGWWSIQEWEIE